MSVVTKKTLHGKRRYSSILTLSGRTGILRRVSVGQARRASFAPPVWWAKSRDREQQHGAVRAAGDVTCRPARRKKIGKPTEPRPAPCVLQGSSRRDQTVRDRGKAIEPSGPARRIKKTHLTARRSRHRRPQRPDDYSRSGEQSDRSARTKEYNNPRDGDAEENAPNPSRFGAYYPCRAGRHRPPATGKNGRTKRPLPA
jgi:hypothetical protein